MLEGAAGGLAGACQIVVTTPMEITKIRMQMYKPAPGETVNQMAILSKLVREMGITCVACCVSTASDAAALQWDVQGNFLYLHEGLPLLHRLLFPLRHLQKKARR